MGGKSKAGGRRSSSPFTHACAETRMQGGLGQWLHHGEVELGMGVCVCACARGTGREQSNRLEKVTVGGEGRGLQLVPDALRS